MMNFGFKALPIMSALAFVSELFNEIVMDTVAARAEISPLCQHSSSGPEAWKLTCEC